MKCQACGYTDERFFKSCPKCGEIVPGVETPTSNLQGGTASKIAYLGVEMMKKHPGDALGELMYQIAQLKDKKMQAWFVDIVHEPKQTGEALWLEQEVIKKLNEVAPWQKVGGDN